MKLLSAHAHGFLDYVSVIAFAIAPTLFGFGGWPAVICYLLAAVHLLLTLVTSFPLGMWDAVAFRAHGAIELVVSLLLVALPWIAGFTEAGAQWFFVGIGVVLFAVWLLTDYRAAEPAAED